MSAIFSVIPPHIACLYMQGHANVTHRKQCYLLAITILPVASYVCLASRPAFEGMAVAAHWVTLHPAADLYAFTLAEDWGVWIEVIIRSTRYICKQIHGPAEQQCDCNESKADWSSVVNAELISFILRSWHKHLQHVTTCSRCTE